MGVQTKILTSQGPTITPVEGKSFAGAVGTLAIGKPGDVVSRAFGPLTYAEVTGADAVMGAFVAGKGVLVNSNDVPNRSNFESTITVKAGDTAAFMTYGTFVTTGDKLAAINTGMNARIVYPFAADGSALDIATETETADATAAYEVEVTGFKVG